MGSMRCLISLLLLVGCSGKYSLSVEKEFTDEEVELITSAVDEWMIACDCYDASVFFRFDLPTTKNLETSEYEDAKDYGRLWKINKNEPVYIDRKKDRNKDFNGRHFSGNIVLLDSLEGVSLTGVMLHELGHLYGIDHQVSGLMASDGGKYGCIDWRALSEFCDIDMHTCGAGAHPTCKN